MLDVATKDGRFSVVAETAVAVAVVAETAVAAVGVETAVAAVGVETAAAVDYTFALKPYQSR